MPPISDQPLAILIPHLILIKAFLPIGLSRILSLFLLTSDAVHFMPCSSDLVKLRFLGLISGSIAMHSCVFVETSVKFLNRFGLFLDILFIEGCS
jgi:hypothetical protein